MFRQTLLAVGLLNHAVDVNRAKNSSGALIIIDDNAITPRKDVDMIRRWD
jgi:hypothetical protein